MTLEPQEGGAQEDRVVVVTGVGGMGSSVARRMGPGSILVLADIDSNALQAAAVELQAEGHRVVVQVTDVSDGESVTELANLAAGLGRVEVLVHTAGVSPVQASVEAIVNVDLLGTALILDAFGSKIAPGGAGVIIASMAGSMSGNDPEWERRLATTPTLDLLALPELSPERLSNPGTAYQVAKRANQVRVRAASLIWGRRSARVNSISPGVISTSMGNAELNGPVGELMREMIAASPTGRLGTPSDIAAAVQFLAGPEASFITGTDLLVDGGVVAAMLASPSL